MSRHTHEFIIDRYATSHYMPDYGWPLFLRLVEIFGEPFAKVIAAQDKWTKAGMMDANLSEVMKDIAGLALETLPMVFGKLRPDEFVPLAERIMSGMTKNDKPLNFHADFIGQYLLTFKVLKEVITFQFGDFLGKSLPASNPAPVRARRA